MEYEPTREGRILEGQRRHEGRLGKMTGNKKMQAEGKWDKAKGEMQKKAGDMKDAVKKASR